MNTLENNKLIAEFMGLDCPPINGVGYYNSDELEYHNSWDWLMPVVEKIESLEYWTEIVGGMHHEFRIGKLNNTKECINRDSENKIEAVYNAVVDFIRGYN